MYQNIIFSINGFQMSATRVLCLSTVCLRYACFAINCLEEHYFLTQCRGDINILSTGEVAIGALLIFCFSILTPRGFVSFPSGRVWKSNLFGWNMQGEEYWLRLLVSFTSRPEALLQKLWTGWYMRVLYPSLQPAIISHVLSNHLIKFSILHFFPASQTLPLSLLNHHYHQQTPLISINFSEWSFPPPICLAWELAFCPRGMLSASALWRVLLWSPLVPVLEGWVCHLASIITSQSRYCPAPPSPPRENSCLPLVCCHLPTSLSLSSLPSPPSQEVWPFSEMAELVPKTCPNK